MGHVDTSERWTVSLTEAEDSDEGSAEELGPYGTFEQAKLVALFQLLDRSENGGGIEREEAGRDATTFRTSGGRWTARVHTG